MFFQRVGSVATVMKSHGKGVGTYGNTAASTYRKLVAFGPAVKEEVA